MWRTWSANICGCLFYGSLGLWRLEFRQGLDGPGGDTAIVVLRTRNDHPLAYLQISHTHPVYFSMTVVSVACTWVSPSEVVTIRVSSSTDLMVPMTPPPGRAPPCYPGWGVRSGQRLSIGVESLLDGSEGRRSRV